MKVAPLLLLFLSLCTAGNAQTKAPLEYIDVVSLRAGGDARGTILEYSYKDKVVLLDENGEIVTLEW